ncbi:SPRY domain-containing protein 3 [Lates japonicus]|uniref:SPRY domain-containing protein 3 n=1 Tax=Lates japonicus TaxID=270547 RepID=A0AAD3MAV4_LATJO|nr:SPRY domain-containing protein 3 [Lates japonicus]
MDDGKIFGSNGDALVRCFKGDIMGCIKVFFTRNGKLMGRREMAVPPGGLYPTVGMLSSGEKVKVDLHPLSG